MENGFNSTVLMVGSYLLRLYNVYHVELGFYELLPYKEVPYSA